MRMPFSIAAIILVLLTAVIGLVFTREIRRAFSRFRSREHKAGKELIYRHFPKHKKPLGGGMAIFAALTVGLGLTALLNAVHLSPVEVPATAWACLLCGLAYGVIGFVDDWRKVNAAHGLNEWVKLALQAILALLFTFSLFACSLREVAQYGPTAVFLPFVGWLQLGYLFLPFGMLVIIGASNAVNLTDGLDGLAGSSMAISFAGYILLGGLLQHESIPVILPLLALASLAGFLFYNRPPAKIIMGDTGALGLGAVLGMLALVSHTEWLLLLFAAPFVIDTVSVIIQVAVIKFFRGPVKLLRHQTTEIFRPFLCTPLHHHFQWLTWGPWPILGLFNGVALFSVVLALLALPAADVHEGVMAYGWFWFFGMLLQVAFLVFAALQKVVRANYFFGLERPEGSDERMLALYKGLPIEVFKSRWYNVEEITQINEGMMDAIAAEGILWRNISEIEARVTLGKIYAEYKYFDEAAEEWEEIPPRNLLIRENLVVQLGKIYYGRDELLRAIKLWEQLPSSRLARVPGLPETIQSAKVRMGHLAGRIYHQANEHAVALQRRMHDQPAPSSAETSLIIAELENALRYTQELRDLLGYEQHKAEAAGELEDAEDNPDLYRRMDAMLATRRDDLHQHLLWAQSLEEPAAEEDTPTPLQELSRSLFMTPAEISRALELNVPLQVTAFARVQKSSRNTIYRIALDSKDARLPAEMIAKCYDDAQVSFFSACYRRERGVLQILQEADAPVPHLLGGHLGSRIAVLFLEDLGANDMISVLREIPPDNRSARLNLLRRGLESLVMLRVQAHAVMPRLEREIAKIVKEVLTPEYFTNTTTIALGRILALQRRHLAKNERGKLEVALHPLITRLLEEPKTFIHFEYTPRNLQLCGDRIIAMDFEQATLGPAAFDLATLFYGPEADLTYAEIEQLLAFYHELLPAAAPATFKVGIESLETAAIMKLLFYAGSAANFYRKFEEDERLLALKWYLQNAERLIMRYRPYHELAEVLHRCWDGQMQLALSGQSEL